jgi:protein PhnA
MKINQAPELHAFICQFFDSDPEQDENHTRTFIAGTREEQRQRLIRQTRLLLADTEMPIDELGSEANRWFASSEEARSWLLTILSIFEGGKTGEAQLVKDSNGTLLCEDDAVYVIKDLKVKGGSSDLKRGTLIKRIHLIDDSEAVECRVDGTTLVLKTCFLKKA